MPTARPSRRKLIMLTIFALFLAPLIARAALYAAGNGPRSWRDADWSSTGTLPPAGDSKPARVIVFTGTAGAWKGIFAVHSWIVLKRANAPGWTRYDVVGWGNPVRTNGWPPDGRWFGNMPVAIADVSGADAEKLIPRIEAAVRQPTASATPATIASGRGRTATASPPRCCARCRNSAWRCRRTRSAAISATASMPAAPTAAPASSSTCAVSRRSSSAGSRASRSICSGWSPGSICAIPGVKLPGFGRIGVESPVATALAK